MAPQAKEKPLIASGCQLDDWKPLKDAIAFMLNATSVTNAAADAPITTFLWFSFKGDSGLDYIAFFTGETLKMVKVMDGVKNGTVASAFAESETFTGYLFPSRVRVKVRQHIFDKFRHDRLR